ncbi:hypothetical protein [Allosphingosinicella deserti]|nr:hypothetical protein [Sphingomonas deserti]
MEKLFRMLGLSHPARHRLVGRARHMDWLFLAAAVALVIGVLLALRYLR